LLTLETKSYLVGKSKRYLYVLKCGNSFRVE
jgi:hypothetical protein